MPWDAGTVTSAANLLRDIVATRGSRMSDRTYLDIQTALLAGLVPLSDSELPWPLVSTLVWGSPLRDAQCRAALLAALTQCIMVPSAELVRAANLIPNAMRIFLSCRLRDTDNPVVVRAALLGASVCESARHPRCPPLRISLDGFDREQARIEGLEKLPSLRKQCAQRHKFHSKRRRL